jgi:hypothetical protein
MNNRSVGEKFIRIYSTDPMAVRTRNWRAKNKMRNAVQRKIYMSQEKNFVRVFLKKDIIQHINVKFVFRTLH